MTGTEPPLYDVARAVGELNHYRAAAASDPVAAQSVKIADELARFMARHFADGHDRRTSGCAVIIAAASLGALRELPVEVVCNIAGLAGHELNRGCDS